MNYRRYFTYILTTAVISGAIFYGLSGSNATLLKTTIVPVATTSVFAENISTSLSVEGVRYAASIAAHTTVLEMMREVQKKQTFTFSGREYPSLGFFVESINGKESADGYYWFLYVNGKESPKGVSQTFLSSGDAIEWRYKKGY